MRVLSTDSGGS